MGWNRREATLVATAALLVFSRVFGLSLVLPNFRGHFEPMFDPLWTGVAFSAYGLTMALMQLPAGWLSDRIGRRPMLILASLLFVGGSLVAALADSLVWLLVGRLVQGLGAVASVAMAAVGEAIPAERRTFAMAMVGVPAGAGFLLGLAVGPALYPLVSMSGLFLVTAAMGAAAGLGVLIAPFAAPKDRPTAAMAGSIWPIVALASGGFITNYALTTTLFHLPTTDWRALLPMLALALILVGGLSRRIDRSGWTWQPVALGLLAVAVAAPWFALGEGAGWTLWVAGAAFFTVHATLATVLPSQVSRIAGASGGRGHGIQNIVAYTGTFVAGPVAGAMASRPFGAFLVLAALTCLSLALLLIVFGRQAGSVATPA